MKSSFDMFAAGLAGGLAGGAPGAGGGSSGPSSATMSGFGMPSSNLPGVPTGPQAEYRAGEHGGHFKTADR